MRALTLVVEAISDKDILNQCPTENLRDHLANQLIESLLDLIRGEFFHIDLLYCVFSWCKAPSLPSSVTPHFDELLLERLFQLLRMAISAPATQETVLLTCRSFEAILEISMLSASFWSSVEKHMLNSTILRELILDDPVSSVRKTATKLIMDRCLFATKYVQTSLFKFVQN